MSALTPSEFERTRARMTDLFIQARRGIAKVEDDSSTRRGATDAGGQPSNSGEVVAAPMAV